MPQLTHRPTKITFAELRESGVHGLLVYCADYRCSHSVAISADRWPDQVRLSDIEPQFVCQVRQARCRRPAAFPASPHGHEAVNEAVRRNSWNRAYPQAVTTT